MVAWCFWHREQWVVMMSVLMCVCESFIPWPHRGTKCTSRLFSCVQDSVSCYLKPRELQSSQAENRSGIWTSGLTCLWPSAHKVTPSFDERGITLLYETAVIVCGSVKTGVCICAWGGGSCVCVHDGTEHVLHVYKKILKLYDANI